jgi:hypothetical protein
MNTLHLDLRTMGRRLRGSALAAPLELVVRGRILLQNRDAVARKPQAAIRYLASGRELSNFTYEIQNRDDLLEFIARSFGIPPSAVVPLAAEIEGDAVLRSNLERRLASRRDREPHAFFGRRVGWYCVCRLLAPSVVVETGTRDGLGTALLLRALEHNRRLGHPGMLLSFDIDPTSGWLVGDEYVTFLELHIGDTRTTLPLALNLRQVGLFIHDSLHTYEHELFEFNTALQNGTNDIVLISDNAHATSALSDLASAAGMEFAFFAERPRDHFYRGGGIGLAFSEAARARVATLRAEDAATPED